MEEHVHQANPDIDKLVWHYGRLPRRLAPLLLLIRGYVMCINKLYHPHVAYSHYQIEHHSNIIVEVIGENTNHQILKVMTITLSGSRQHAHCSIYWYSRRSW